MSDDIRAGDVVVDIGADACPYPSHGSSILGEVGKVYRVIATNEWWDGRPVFVLSGSSGLWCGGCFRKIEAAEDCFVKAMRGLVPLETEVT